MLNFKKILIGVLLLVFLLSIFWFGCMTPNSSSGGGGGSGIGLSSGIFLWSKRLGGISIDEGKSVSVDASGNIYVTGSIYNDADLNGDGDSLDAGESYTGYGNYDIFISKFSSSGTFLWAKRLGRTNYDTGNSITIDSNGDVLVTGTVYENADLNGDGDSSDGVVESTWYGGSDIFISKFNSSGGHLWSKRLGGTSGDSGYSIAIDSSNNIILTGIINGDADLNEDGDFLDAGEEATGYGGDDIFISKFDSSGGHLWSKRLGGTLNDNGYYTDIDGSDNILITGWINGNADLNGDGDSIDGVVESTGYGGADIFISKFDSSGGHLLSKRLGGINYDKAHSIKRDSGNNIIISGYVNGDADLNEDGDSTDEGESSAGYGDDDIFISKYDSSGVFIWAKRLGNTVQDKSYGIAIDSSNNIFITGYVFEDADLNGDGDFDDIAESSVGYGLFDIFVSKFNSSGTHLWSKRLGGTFPDTGINIATDSSGRILITGYVYNDADLNEDGDYDDEGESATGYGNSDIFIAKFSN